MAGTLHLKTKNFERHPPIVPANPYFQGVSSNYSLGLGGYVDGNGAWISDSQGRGLILLQPSTTVREPVCWHVVTGSNGASILGQRTEAIFYPPSAANGQLTLCNRVDVPNKNYLIGFIRTDIARVAIVLNDTYIGAVTSDGNPAMSQGQKYRAVFDTTGSGPTTCTLRIYSWTDPTAPIVTVSGTNNTAQLQAAGTAGWGSRYAAPFDGQICEVSYFSLGTDRTAGMPSVLSYSADGTTVTLWAREPDNFTGSASHQWQVSTTGLNSGWANIVGATSLKLTNYALADGVDHHFRIVQTDSNAAGSPVTSTVIGPIRRKRTQKRVLIADSRGVLTTLAGDGSLQNTADWNSERWQAYFLERMLPDRFVLYPANVSHGGATSADFVNASGQYYASTHASVVANAPDEADIQLGANDGRGAITKAAYKANILNIIAWLKADGVRRIWLHDPPFYYEDLSGVDLLAQYSAALDEIVGSDTSGKVKRGVRRETFRAQGSAYPESFEYSGLHVEDTAFITEAINRAKAIAVSEATPASADTGLFFQGAF